MAWQPRTTALQAIAHLDNNWRADTLVNWLLSKFDVYGICDCLVCWLETEWRDCLCTMLCRISFCLHLLFHLPIENQNFRWQIILRTVIDHLTCAADSDKDWRDFELWHRLTGNSHPESIWIEMNAKFRTSAVQVFKFNFRGAVIDWILNVRANWMKDTFSMCSTNWMRDSTMSLTVVSLCCVHDCQCCWHALMNMTLGQIAPKGMPGKVLEVCSTGTKFDKWNAVLMRS